MPKKYGQDLWRMLRSKEVGAMDPTQAMTFLRDEAGIPGLRYLDHGSRGRSDSVLDPQIAAYRKRLDTDRDLSKIERSEIQGKLDDMLAERARVEKQTSNYVLFDDSLVDILRKYALPGAVGAGFGFAPRGEQ